MSALFMHTFIRCQDGNSQWQTSKMMAEIITVVL